MSISGVPPEISALQATQAQREAAKARDRSRFGSERGRKANPEDEVVRALADEGSCFDIASLPEMDACLRLGVGARRLINRVAEDHVTS